MAAGCHHDHIGGDLIGHIDRVTKAGLPCRSITSQAMPACSKLHAGLHSSSRADRRRHRARPFLFFTTGATTQPTGMLLGNSRATAAVSHRLAALMRWKQILVPEHRFEVVLKSAGRLGSVTLLCLAPLGRGPSHRPIFFPRPFPHGEAFPWPSLSSDGPSRANTGCWCGRFQRPLADSGRQRHDTRIPPRLFPLSRAPLPKGPA